MTAPAAEWPAADEIARIIVAAPREEDDDPVLVAEGRFAPRSRVYAFLALAHQFPAIARKEIAAKVGARTPNLPAGARAAVLRRGGLTWFDLDKRNRAAGRRTVTLARARSCT